MAHRDGGQRIEFMVAIEGAADMERLAASANRVENDPELRIP
jgi:hypothetical protein